MKKQKKKSIIIFDLDDTLVPSEEHYSQALRKVGINPTGKPYTTARSSVKANLPDLHTSARSRLLYFKKLLETKGDFSPQKVLTLTEKYENALFTLTKKSWKQLKRKALFKKLSKHFRLAVLTNENTRTQLLKMKAMDPQFDLFEYVLTSEEVGFEKPNKKPFDTLMTRLGNPPASRVMFVGDSFVNDIGPSLKRKWTAVWTREFLTPEQRKIKPPRGVVVIDSLEELPYKLGL